MSRAAISTDPRRVVIGSSVIVYALSDVSPRCDHPLDDAERFSEEIRG
jgi:hypothetical protein